MSALSVHRDRYSFGNIKEALELPDLIAIQHKSFKWLLDEGLAETFRDISPIKDFQELSTLRLSSGFAVWVSFIPRLQAVCKESKTHKNA